jgi:hypothetical protein
VYLEACDLICAATPPHGIATDISRMRVMCDVRESSLFFLVAEILRSLLLGSLGIHKTARAQTSSEFFYLGSWECLNCDS